MKKTNTNKLCRVCRICRVCRVRIMMMKVGDRKRGKMVVKIGNMGIGLMGVGMVSMAMG